jgi:MoaA/NifB/PqqE/SkfB family radical SAM enzyme
MIAQFEVTTRCNFDCFYCAGRLMRQGDMTYEMFSELLNQHIAEYGVPNIVSLQGEGEPTLHHDFFRMAKLVRELGSKPYTITNGTCKHPVNFVGLFDQVGVSVDSLDESAAKAIGRYNLPRVLEFVKALAADIKVVIHAVANAKHTPPIVAWCKKNGYTHVVQPLQSKPDYTLRYMKYPQRPAPIARFSCSYLQQQKMRYYSLDGTVMPCCFIKDVSPYEGLDAMLEHQQAGTTPKCCMGCRYAGGVRRSASAISSTKSAITGLN